MSVVTYLDMRNSAASQIKEAFAARRGLRAAAHPGNFDAEEIRRLVTRTPAILTALMKIADRDANDESWLDFVSWVVYRANNQDTLYDGAIKIVSALIPVIRNLDAPWCAGGGSGIEASSLYAGALDKINITLWAVRWRWQVRGAVLEGGEGGILLPDSLEYFEGYEASHTVGQRDIQDSVDLEVNKDGHSNDANPG
ncbi:MAG: hypothetical protein LBK13_06680 [Spirochaetales bacterium]|jgi:hypothetical protein|nr:hypothetical protein [Spirochaetales bacterium]